MSGGLGKLRIRGVVTRDGAPVDGAYLTLNAGEDFIAERRTGTDGFYEFHTTPGAWTVTCRASGSDAVSKDFTSDAGEVEASFDL